MTTKDAQRLWKNVPALELMPSRDPSDGRKCAEELIRQHQPTQIIPMLENSNPMIAGYAAYVLSAIAPETLRLHLPDFKRDKRKLHVRTGSFVRKLYLSCFIEELLTES